MADTEKFEAITDEEMSTVMGGASNGTVSLPCKHIVAGKENLWVIAKKYYGNGALWGPIYNANKSVIGPNPDLIKPGQVLDIPKI